MAKKPKPKTNPSAPYNPYGPKPTPPIKEWPIEKLPVPSKGS